MISRRQFLAGAACLCHSVPGIAATKQKIGCILYNSDPRPNDGGLAGLGKMPLSLEYANGLIAILADLKDHLAVTPTFALYDDSVENPNALSCETALLPNSLGTSEYGTVAVGRKMMVVLQKKAADLGTDFGSALTSTCAHEFGHILQFKTVIDKLQRLPNGYIRTELHADFISGYYGAHRKEIDRNYDVLTQAVTQFEAGDRDSSGNATYKATSHGTADQRGDAVYGGFLLGLKGKLDPKAVADNGLDYVRGLSL